MTRSGSTTARRTDPPSWAAGWGAGGAGVVRGGGRRGCDGAPAGALAFGAGRLGAESVGLVLAVRERGFDALPELAVRGLDDEHAHQLLDAVITGPLDARVRERILT